jgi:hypothetical protein
VGRKGEEAVWGVGSGEDVALGSGKGGGLEAAVKEKKWPAGGGGCCL